MKSLRLPTLTPSGLRNLGFGKCSVGMEAQRLAKEDYQRWKRAFCASPDKWLGPNYTPGTPEQESLREALESRAEEGRKAVLKKVELAVKNMIIRGTK